MKIILDLCGGTGSWSKPYRDAGYDVRLVTLPETDVRSYEPSSSVHGVLASPPCTHFTISGSQFWKEKDLDGRTLIDLEIVCSVLRIVAMTRPQFWALENPVGRLRRWIGPPAFSFDPCDFGDAYTKRTLLWGRFIPPSPLFTTTKAVEPEFIVGKKDGKRYSPIHFNGRRKDRAAIRSITPPGFAKAFFEANP